MGDTSSVQASHLGLAQKYWSTVLLPAGVGIIVIIVYTV